MTRMRARMSSNFGLLRPLVAELATLARLKKSPSAVLDRILFILAGNDNIHESLDQFEIRPDSTSGFHGNR